MSQTMLSPTRLAPEGPTLLLAPGDCHGALGSKGYDHAQAELDEAPSIVKIAGMYALIYSTRVYRSLDYKVGVAWSDTLIEVAPPVWTGWRRR